MLCNLRGQDEPGSVYEYPFYQTPDEIISNSSGKRYILL
jgi:hypothetical protein